MTTAQNEYVVNLNQGIQPTDGYLQNIKDSLESMYNNYVNAQVSSQNILNQQGVINDIVDKEKIKIDKEQTKLEQILDTNNRNNDLKDSARKKQNAYNYLLFIIIMILVLCVIISFIRKLLPILPDALFLFLYTLILSVGIIYLLYIYYGIYRRDSIHFDELQLNPPPSKDAYDIIQQQQNAKKTGDLLGSVNNPNICNGADCCSNNSIFDGGIGKCILKCPGSNDDPLNTIYFEGRCIAPTDCNGNSIICGKSCIPDSKGCLVSEGFNMINQTIKPFSANEFENYSKYF